MKALRVLGLLTVIVFSLALGAYASEWGLYRGFPIVKVNVDGQDIDSDVPAITIDGRALVPLRVISEALGANVNWDPGTKTVTIVSKSPPLNYEPPTEEGRYKAGDEIEMTKAVVLISGVRYSTKYEDYAAPDGYKYVILDLKVKALANPPGSFKSVGDVFRRWNLSDGTTDATFFTTGTNPMLYRNQWVAGTVVARIPHTLTITSVDLTDTGNDTVTVYLE
ncbi:MAG: copper amine oxidase N-terminal domain-containing protein [Bacillota bacterium]|uniref:copper amine oxidase N-terminal domain-containing protein n=1 Tax=Desulforudis sp. DRI-14 TaxID=3459793 RepID=UPI003BDA4341